MSWLLTTVLNWIWGKLSDYLGGLLRFFQRAETIKKEEQASVEPLKKAETEAEIDKATHDALDDL